MNIKIVKYSSVVVIALLFFILVSNFFINNSQVLVGIKHKVITKLEEKLETEVEFKSINIAGINQLIINQVQIKDQEGNNLLNVDQVILKYKLLDLLLNKFKLLTSISNIELVGPQVRVIKRDDQDWNYQFLLDQFKSEDEERRITNKSTVSIYIKQGAVNYITNQFQDKLEEITGKVKVGSKTELDLTAKVKSIAEEEFSLKGTLEDRTYQGLVEFDKLQLAKVTDKINLDILESITIEGSASGKVKFKGDLTEQPTYYGNVSLAEGSFSREKIEFKGMKGQFSFNNYGFKIKDLEAFYKKIPINLSGQVFSWTNPQLNIKYNIKQMSLKDIIPDKYKVTGKAKISGKIKGRAVDPSIIGKINVPQGQIDKYNLNNFESQIYYKDKILSLEELNFKYGTGQVEGRGTVNFNETLNYNFSTSFENMKLGKLLNSILDYNFDLVGTVNGDAIISGVGLKKDNLDLLGSISMQQGSIKDYQFNKLQTNFLLNDSKLFLNHTKLKTKDSSYNLDGLVRLDGGLDLSLKAENVKLKELSGIHRLDKLEGVVDLSGQLTGNITNPEFKGKFIAEELEFNQLNPGKVAGQIDLTPAEIELNEVQIPETSSKLEGTIDLATKKSNLKITTNQSKADKLLTTLGIDLPVTGIASGRATITAIQPTISLRGEAIIEHGKFFEQNFDQVDLKFKYDNREFIIEPSQAKYNDSKIKARGSFANSQLNLKVKSDKLNLADINYVPEDINLTGIAKAEGRIFGPTSDLRVAGQVESNEVNVNNYLLGQVRGDVTYEHKQAKLSVKEGEVKARDNNYKFKGRLDCSTREFDSLEVTAKKGTVDYISQFSAIQFNVPYQFSGQVKATGPILAPQTSLNLSIQDIDKQGSLKLIGDYEFKEAVNMDLIAQEFNLNPLNNLKLIPYELAGRLNLKGKMSGKLENLDFSSQLTVIQGEVSQLDYQQLTGEVELINGQRLVIDQFMKIDANKNLKVNGQVPLDSSEEFDLKLELKGGLINILPLWLKDVEDIKGTGRADLEIVGTWQEPEIIGQAKFGSAAFKHPVFDRKITDLNGNFDFTGDKIKFDGVRGNYGAGKFNLEGDVILDGLLPKIYDLKFKGKKIVFEHGSWQGLNDIEVAIEENFAAPLITGQITAYDTQFNLPFKWPTINNNSGTSKINPQFDLKIRPGENVRVGNSNIDVLVQSGNLNLISGEQGLELTGELKSNNGEFNYYNTEFELEKGSATFRRYSYIPNLQIEANTEVQSIKLKNNTELQNASLEVSSETGDNSQVEDNSEEETITEVEDIKINLNLYGPANDLDFNLSSQPPLSRREILALLTKQGGIGSLLKKDYEQAVKEELFRMIGTGIRTELISKVEESVEKTLDLDQFKLKSVLSDKAELEIGKFIFDNFMLKYNHQFGIGEEEALGFEYHFTDGLDNLVIDGEYNTEDEYQLGVEMTIPFK